MRSSPNLLVFDLKVVTTTGYDRLGQTLAQWGATYPVE